MPSLSSFMRPSLGSSFESSMSDNCFSTCSLRFFFLLILDCFWSWNRGDAERLKRM